eukprot:6185763-Pleurochrysis_carterae.AAC.1
MPPLPTMSIHSTPAASPARAPPLPEPSQKLVEMRAGLAKMKVEAAEEAKLQKQLEAAECAALDRAAA